MFRSLRSGERPTPSEIFAVMRANQVFARQCVAIVICALRSLRGNANFFKYAMRRFTRAAKIIQRCVAVLSLKSQAIIARMVDGWIAYEQRTNTITSIDRPTRVAIVRSEYVKQRALYRVHWRTWKKQVSDLQIQRNMVQWERHASSTLTRERLSYFDVRIAQISAKEPKFVFALDYASLLPEVTSFLKRESARKLKAAMESLGIHAKDPEFIQGLARRYEKLVATEKLAVANSTGSKSPTRLSRSNVQTFTGNKDPFALLSPLLRRQSRSAAAKKLSSQSHLERVTLKPDRDEQESATVLECYAALGLTNSVLQEHIESFHWRKCGEQSRIPRPPSPSRERQQRPNTASQDLGRSKSPPKYQKESKKEKLTCEIRRPRCLTPRENRAARIRRSCPHQFPKPITVRMLPRVSPEESMRNNAFYPYHRFWVRENSSERPQQLKEQQNRSPRSPRTAQGEAAKLSGIVWTNGRVTLRSAADVVLSLCSQTSLSDFVAVDTNSRKSQAAPSSGAFQHVFNSLPVTSVSQAAKRRSWRHAVTSSKASLRGHNSSVCCVCFIPSPTHGLPPEFVASGSHDGTLRIWSVIGGEALHTEVHKNRVSQVAASSEFVCSTSDDCSLHVLHVGSWQCAKVFYTKSWLTSLIMQNTMLAGAGYDCAVFVWNLESMEQVYVLEGHLQGITCLAHNPAGLVVSGSLDGSLRVWEGILTAGAWKVNPADLPEHLTRRGPSMDGHSGAVLAVLHMENELFASASVDSTVRIWDAMKCFTVLQVFANCQLLCCMAFTAPSTIVCCCSDGSNRFFSTVNGSFLFETQLDGYVCAAAPLPGGKMLLGNSIGRLYAVSVSGSVVTNSLEGHRDAINVLAVNGSTVVSGSDDRLLYLFDVSDIISTSHVRRISLDTDRGPSVELYKKM